MYYFADLEQQIISLSINTVLIGGGVILGCALIAYIMDKRLKKRQFGRIKLPLFVIIVAAIVISTAILAFNTVYLNVVSESKGPVHWHADIEFWACGSEVELRDPAGWWTNKVGTSTYHEHDDKRIHLEGVVIKKDRDASLGKFMEVTGGYLAKNAIGIPINEDRDKWLAKENHRDGDPHSTDFLAVMDRYVGEDPNGKMVLELRDGSLACGTERGQVQVFVYKFDEENDTYHQTKLEDPASYVIRDEEVVPPGDCVIVEFDRPKRETDKLCQQYGVRDSERCVQFGLKEYRSDLCNIKYEGVR